MLMRPDPNFHKSRQVTHVARGINPLLIYLLFTYGLFLLVFLLFKPIRAIVNVVSTLSFQRFLLFTCDVKNVMLGLCVYERDKL